MKCLYCFGIHKGGNFNIGQYDTSSPSTKELHGLPKVVYNGNKSKFVEHHSPGIKCYM